MRYIKGILTVAGLVLAMLAAPSCTKEKEVDFTDIENRSLKAWMTKHRPDLLGNYQEDGCYYVDVLDAGFADSVTIKSLLEAEESEGCWVSFEFTARDLQGQVCLTRDYKTARMQGTFTKYTHYVPYIRFVGPESGSLMEGTYLAMKNTITLGEKYAADKGLGTTLDIRCGTKLRLYLPSSISGGSAGMSGDGGYEGEFSLDGNRPMIVDIEITDRVNNPVAHEAYIVDGFGAANGGVSPVKEVTDDDDKEKETASRRRRFATRADSDDDEEEEDDGMFWRHACDTIQGLLVTKEWYPDPERQFNYTFPFSKSDDEDGVKSIFRPYADDDVYADLAELNRKIDEALIARFGTGGKIGDEITTSGTARVWYITRLMDGFVIDSNIDEVRELVFGKSDDTSSALSYTADTDKDTYVTSWYYSIPEMHYGQWSTILTTSTFAYGSAGKTGSTTTSSSSSYAYSYYPYSYYNSYYNSYYGSSYYDYYYYNMYNNYYNNMYYSDSSGSETTVQIQSEIQAYQPLIFQIYIEEK